MADFDLKTDQDTIAPQPFDSADADPVSTSDFSAADDTYESSSEGSNTKDQTEAEDAGHPRTASLVDIVTTFVTSFLTGFFRTTPTRTCLRADKKMRDNLDEDQIDAMVEDTFPASDPPSSY